MVELLRRPPNVANRIPLANICAVAVLVLSSGQLLMLRTASSSLDHKLDDGEYLPLELGKPRSDVAAASAAAAAASSSSSLQGGGGSADKSLPRAPNVDPARVERSLKEAPDEQSETKKTADADADAATPLPSPSKQQQQPPKKEKPMNILFLYADDWRHDTMGAAGNPIVKTPAIDRLAKEGVRFTQNCVTTSICWVSRATMLTGQYMARHGTTMPGEWFVVPKNETIFALLKEKGYYTGHVGKLGIWTDAMGQKENIDFRVEYEGWHHENIGGRVWHITEKNEADALRFLDIRPRDKPFFLHVGFYATHAVDGDKRQYMPQNKSLWMYANDTVPQPITATQESWKKMPYFFKDNNEGRTRWRWRYDTPEKHQHMMKNYYRMASEVDTACGAILDMLERQGETENTIIIFTTDNGNFHAEHGLADKWYPHQESIRVPLIIKDPRMAKEKAGSLNKDFTLNIDLAPTLLAAAGVEALPTMMGRDMSVLYLEEKAAEQLAKESGSIQEQRRRDQESGLVIRRHPVQQQDYGFHPHAPLSKVPWRTEFFYEHPIINSKDYIPSSEALVRRGYKYFYWPDFNFEQLFNMNDDPIEDNDLLPDNVTRARNRIVWNEMRSRFLELKRLAHGNSSVTL